MGSFFPVYSHRFSLVWNILELVFQQQIQGLCASLCRLDFEIGLLQLESFPTAERYLQLSPHGID